MTLRNLLREIVSELDADGAGFRTNDAANLLYAKASEGRGDIPGLVERLARRGAREEVANFRPEREAATRTTNDIIAGQRDLAELEQGFDHWVTDIAALDEGCDALRKRVLRMTHPEFVQMIELREQKATQMREYARRARKILTDFPEWADNPRMMLADVLGVSE
ncbi:hypothetical protein [Sediminicoccus sp. BL-A-41-H5]|uniref:hypothetical protein n=1 Tax=Sediminicoccus sp. BL-A-41-H5 TaxID=3421106 RepID=UPI003D664E91